MKTASKVLIAFVVAVIVIAILVVGYTLTKKQNTIPEGVMPSISDNASSTPSDGIATTTPFAFSTSTASTSYWKTYASDELGYEIKYPANLLMNGADATIDFTFPKSAYFHWPLQDDAKVTVIATSTCPAMTVDGGIDSTATTSFMLNGYAFTRREAHDAAAGNLYNEVAYDIMAQGVCYHIDFFDHGSNGAGLYVGDASLIARYDAQHDADLKAVLSVFNAMLQSFHLKTSPAGIPENQAH